MLSRLARAVTCLILATALATPLAAQIGALKKKARAAAGVAPAAEPGAGPAADAGTGGTMVLDDEVIERLIKGYHAAKAERDAAGKSETPYGRHMRQEAAYKAAKPRCDAAAQTFAQRLGANPAMMEKNGRYLELMMAAQQKQDTAAQRAWGDSMLMLQDPSCTVKEPMQPADYWDSRRAVDARAEEAQLKAADMDRRELGATVDRAIAILDDAPPPDVSPSEKNAVEKRKDELNRVMGREPPPAAAATPAPTPAPAAAAPPPSAGPGMTDAQQAAAECMGKNAKKHEDEIARLGERVREAAERGDNAAAMAIADSIRQIQSAGCPSL
jgi:hypothetical protein